MENEQEIKELYKQLKQADAADIPDFKESWGAANRVYTRNRLLTRWTRIAASFLLLFGLAYAWLAYRYDQTGYSEEIAKVEALSTWKSPTASLLKASNDGLKVSLRGFEIGDKPSLGTWQSPTDGILRMN